DAVGQGGVSCSEDGFSKDAKLDVVSVAVLLSTTFFLLQFIAAKVELTYYNRPFIKNPDIGEPVSPESSTFDDDDCVWGCGLSRVVWLSNSATLSVKHKANFHM
ncbi:hypothetical protein ABVT39_025076, partial [Epinephelus coioides]